MFKNCFFCNQKYNINDTPHKKFCSSICYNASVSYSKKQYYLKNKDEIYKKFNEKRTKKFICPLCNLLTSNKNQHNKSKYHIEYMENIKNINNIKPTNIIIDTQQQPLLIN